MMGIETFDAQGNMTFGSGDTTLKYLGTLTVVFPYNIYPGHTVDTPLAGATPTSVINELSLGVAMGQIQVTPFTGFIRIVSLIETYNYNMVSIVKVYQI